MCVWGAVMEGAGGQIEKPEKIWTTTCIKRAQTPSEMAGCMVKPIKMKKIIKSA